MRRLAGLLLLAAAADGVYDAVHKVESARIYGNINEYAYYFVDLLVGTPPQRVSVILDTGSGVVGFPCANCGHCGQHIDAAFDFSRSSTASWVSCDDGCPWPCKSGHCAYHQGYVEGSSIDGFLFQDLVRLGDMFQSNPPVTVRMGCHQNENKLFYTQKANGILGVGPRARSGRTLLQELYLDSEHISGGIFAICLSDEGGALAVGGHNTSHHTGPVQYVPLDVHGGNYGVRLTSMELGGRVIHHSFGSTMIDSGTTYSYFSSAAYGAIKGAIVAHCEGHGSCGAKKEGGTCWKVPNGAAGLGHFPSLRVAFERTVTTWSPQGYLYHKGGGLWCFAFEDDGARANTVLGAAWMRHQDVIFDVQGGRVGIAPARCPEFWQRPPAPFQVGIDLGGGLSLGWMAVFLLSSGLFLWGLTCGICSVCGGQNGVADSAPSDAAAPPQVVGSATAKVDRQEYDLRDGQPARAHAGGRRGYH